MKKKIEIILEHIAENYGLCNCSMCHKQEHGTFTDGLKIALSLIQKRK